ncbi:MAG: SUF system Fe-S cluster assembly regulator [Rhodospirillales bacterium]|nr:SUF system Fe-S cluster assembly regulator [Rhodospirillales bacterium]
MIKISRMADYGVLILAELAREPEALRTASGLSDTTGLPEPTVAKILKTLTGAGILRSARGVNGGYLLQKTADQIPVAAIITALDGPICLTACADGVEDSCAVRETCSLKGRWNGVNALIKSALEAMTLAELLESGTEKVQKKA